jgi:hypothetical protein
MHLGLKALPLTLVALASNGISQTLYCAHEGVASGNLNGVAFATTPFTINYEWDIGAVQSPGPGVFTADHTSASIDITGVGTFSFITPTRSFNNQNVPVVGFSRGSGADLFNGPFDPALSGWSLASPIGPLTGSASVFQWTGVNFTDVVTSGGVLVLDSASGVPCTYTVSFNPSGIGSNYCGPAVLNSTGSSGTISGTGSAVVANNDLTLVASNLPLSSFGYFLTSRTQGNVPQPGGSQGVLCLTGNIGRYVGPGQIQNTGAVGSFDLLLDLTQTPTPTGIVSIAVGETWNFQAWHRDAVGGAATSNFTDGYEVLFQ